MASLFTHSSLDTASGQQAAGRFAQGTVLQVEEHSCVVQRFISAGGQADVYLVTMLSDGTAWALKHVVLGDDSESDERRRQAEHEIDVMRRLTGHAQIVGLKAAEVTATAAYILMEHCAGSVVDLMNDTLPDHLSEQTVLRIFSDACKAIAHMHYQSPPMLHRDIKAENMLADGTGGYKLCDFGSATSQLVAGNTRLTRAEIVQLEEDIQRNTTLEYRAPEMVDLYLQRGISEQADIWSLGVLLYKLCYSRTPFDNASPLTILNAEYSVPDTPRYSRELRQVFQMTLREEPRERSNIYMLSKYVCGLLGEQCLLENRYAEQVPVRAEARGLGWVSALPPHKQPQQPRRYAASVKAAEESEADAVVPMRRGRPPRPGAGASSSSASPGGSRAASPAPRTTQAFGPRQPPSSTPLSAPIQTSASDALGIFDDLAPQLVAANDGSSSSRRVRMSVRAADGRESLSADFVQGAVFGSARRTSVLRRTPSIGSPVSRHSSLSGRSMASMASPDADVLPGFVCQPLPPPPLSPPAHAGLVSPESLSDADAWAVPSDEAALRLSTILEAFQTDRTNTSPANPPAAADQSPMTRDQRVRSIYAVTLDKLDDASFGVTLDDPRLFTAKAQYAAQRGSIYQASAASSSASDKMLAEAAHLWSDMPGDIPVQSRSAMDAGAWAGEGPATVDVNSVLKRAGERNRRLLVAQNNRRSMYIANHVSAPAPGETPQLPALQPEDVDDNMRVLSEQEIEELLERMDAYNRELLSEQQRWGRRPVEGPGEMAVLEDIIAEANVQLLREEQAAGLCGERKGEAVALAQVQAAVGVAAPAERVPEEKPVEKTEPAERAPEEKPVEKTEPVEQVPEEKPAEVVKPEEAPQPEKPVDVAKPEEEPKQEKQSETAEPVTYDETSQPTQPPQPEKPAESTHQVTYVEPTPPAKPPRAQAQPRSPPTTQQPQTAGRPATAPAPSPATASSALPPPAHPASTVAVPKLPSMPRAQTEMAPPPSTAGDPLAEARMRLRRKQSSPALDTAPGGAVSARGKFLDAAKNDTPRMALETGKKPVKSVRNLVAMFEKS